MKFKIEMDTSDENYDKNDMNIIVNRAKIKCAAYSLGDLLRVLVNRKFYDETKYKYDQENEKCYVDIDWIEREVQSIYNDLNFLDDC